MSSQVTASAWDHLDRAREATGHFHAAAEPS